MLYSLMGTASKGVAKAETAQAFPVTTLPLSILNSSASSSSQKIIQSVDTLHQMSPSDSLPFNSALIHSHNKTILIH